MTYDVEGDLARIGEERRELGRRVMEERDPPMAFRFMDACPDCTNRAPICPSCWGIPEVEEAGRCPCSPPLHVLMCPGRWGNLVYCSPTCRVRPYVAYLHALGGCFAAPTRIDLHQPHRLAMTEPEGVPFMLGKPAGLCGDHCGMRLNVTTSAVRRGVYLYSPEHDPAPACYLCGRDGAHICERCQDRARAAGGFARSLASRWEPRTEGVPFGFRKDAPSAGFDAKTLAHVRRVR